jgi:hypothetical protein
MSSVAFAANRLMAEHDTDLDFDFDFFDDDPEPSEPHEEERPPREPPRAGGGVTPLVRLAGLVAFAILVVVLLVFWISSCQGAGKKSSYKRYMAKMAVIAKDSEQHGRELNDALTTPGSKFAGLNTRISSIAQGEQQDVAAARQMNPPGPLRLQPAHPPILVEASTSPSPRTPVPSLCVSARPWRSCFMSSQG